MSEDRPHHTEAGGRDADDARSDEQLVAAANRGDAGAFEALYRRYRQFVLRIARRYVLDDGDALDVLQEVFVYVLGKFPGFVLSARFTTFLYPVAKHQALALRRRRIGKGGVQPGGGLEQGEHDELVVHPPVQRDLHELAGVLAVLPSAQREVVLMRFVDDLQLDEIAAVLGVPLGTVKSRLHHAIGTLREDARTRAYFGQDAEKGRER